MEPSRTDIRNLLRYEFLRGVNATEATKNVIEAHGANLLSKSVAYEWFSRFKSGNFAVEFWQAARSRS